MTDDRHVVPIDDLKEHVTQRDCWCDPVIEECDGGVVIVHNSLDRRELYENSTH